ncbi:MAG: hypothetical protein DLM68_12545, partial [Hyphomicrobiales bacterium]
REKRREIQERLLVMQFDPGKISGVFNKTTRRAIAGWQKGHELPATGWLAPLQYAALLAESEAPLRRFPASPNTSIKLSSCTSILRASTPVPPSRCGAGGGAPRHGRAGSGRRACRAGRAAVGGA